MQPALRSSIPDASLAVFPVNGENSHQGLAGRNPAPNQVREVCNFTVLLGLQSAAVLNRVGSRSTGKERDQESGNDYFGARYYASNVGGWMSPDSGIDQDHTNPQSLNLYSYVRNNPLNRVDPNGQLTIIVPGTDWSSNDWNMNMKLVNEARQEFHDPDVRILGSPGNGTWTGGPTGSARAEGIQ